MVLALLECILLSLRPPSDRLRWLRVAPSLSHTCLDPIQAALLTITHF